MAKKTPVFQIEDAADRGRLMSAMKQSERDMESFLHNRDLCLALYQGPRWKTTRASGPPRVPVPFIANAVDVYVQHLSSGNPKALVVPEHDGLQLVAEKLGLAHDRLLQEQQFGLVLEEFVREATIGFPLIKTSYSRVRTSRLHGARHEVGQPFNDVVLTPDVIVDLSAPSWDKMSFVGNKYRVPLAWIQANAGRGGLYRRRDVDKLATAPSNPLDPRNRSRRRSNPASEPIYPQVDLIDLFFPFDNWFVTIPAPGENNSDITLLSEEWNGPKEGPYTPLRLSPVQGEVLPKPLVWDWIDGHDAVNALYVKLIEQAEDMKEVLGVQGNAVKDSERILDAEHGQYIRMDHPNGVKEFRFSGPDQQVLSFAVHLRSLLSNTAGNTDLLSGLSAGSPTATQDQLLFAQGSRRLQDLQSRVQRAVEQIMRKNMWYLFYDPHIDIPLTRRVDNISVRSRYTSQDVRGDFLRYNFTIEPYSMRAKSPEERLRLLIDLVMQLVMPLLPIIIQQGQTVEVKELLKIAGDYSGLPELGRIVKQAERQFQQDPKALGIPSPGAGAPVNRGDSLLTNEMDAVNNLPTAAAVAGGNGRGR